LDEKFKIKDLGKLSFFLDQEITRQKEGIHVNKIKYTLDISVDRGMLAAKSCHTPMNKDIRLNFEQTCTFVMLLEGFFT